MSRDKIAPFLRGNMWWARVPRLGELSVQRSLGVSGKENRDVAVEVCTFLRWLRGRRESFLLDQMALGKTPVGDAYTAYIENRLDTYITDLRDGVTDVDLEPYVDRWQKELVRRKKPQAGSRAKYLRQVRTLIVTGKPFKRSQFTKQRIRDWLSGLEIGQPNRHRAALSSFAEYLVFEDIIPANPVRQVKAAAESDPRVRHLTQLDAKKLLAAFDGLEDFPGPRFKALHALMLATGMEFGAAVAVDPATVTDTTVYAAGTKKHHRRRTTTINERWAWAWEIARAEILRWADGSRPFRAISVHQSNRALRAALKAAKMDTAYTQHDHRHTWAVQAVRDGLALHAVAHQLGHRDATMVLRVYGRFQPTNADFRPKKQSNTPDTATVDISTESSDVR